MSDLWHVRPTRRTLDAARAANISISTVLTHPSGAMPSEPDADGRWAFWPADQYTFRLIEEGAVERVIDDPKSAPARAAKPQE